MTGYRMIITLIWWGIGLPILLGFVWLTADQSIFGDHGGDALDWLLPNLVPTMTLTGAVAYAAPKADDKARPTQQTRFAFRFACVLSVIYLMLVVFAIAGSLSVPEKDLVETPRGALDRLMRWNKILGIFQGFVASAIGIFFARK